MLLPRMYRNPQSMDLGNDTPVYIRDEPGPSSHGGGREVDGSNANGKPGKPNLLKLKDIKPNLKGQEVLIQTPTDDTSWHRSRILEVSVKNRTASMSFPGITQTVTINLGDTIREKRLAWVDSPPVAESSPKTVAPQQGGGLQTQMAWQQQQQQQQQRMGLPERAGANPQMAHQMALQRQMEQQDRNLLGNGGDRANAQRSATMYGYGLQPQLPPQQPPRGPSPQMPRSVVEAIISFGHKAEGVKVEVTLISSGQRRTGVVVRSCPSPKYISVDFGHVQANLKAQDEFSMYSLRILE